MEMIIEAPMEPRPTGALSAGGVCGFLVPRGSGRSGRRPREYLVSRTGGLAAVVRLIHPDRLYGVLEAAFSIVRRQSGVVSVTDAEVIRADRFQVEPSVRHYFRGSPRVIDHAS